MADRLAHGREMERAEAGARSDDDLNEAARVALDEQLRAELGRRLTLVALRAPAAPDEAFAAFQAEIAAYQEVRLLTVAVPEKAESPASQPRPSAEATLEATLREALRVDPDALLIWCDKEARQAGDGDNKQAAWLRAILIVADRMNLFDQAMLALIGPDVVRDYARWLGYEDGFALTPPLATAVHDALSRLTREALTRAEYRHKGSSPPCYL